MPTTIPAAGQPPLSFTREILCSEAGLRGLSIGVRCISGLDLAMRALVARKINDASPNQCLR